MHKFLAVALVAAGALSFACSKSSELVATWKEPNTSSGPFDSVVAIALTGDPSTRRIAEDEFVRRLPKNTTGYSSYKILSKEEEADVDKLVAKLQAEGIHAAAVMRLVEENNSVQHDPGSFNQQFFTLNSYYSGAFAASLDPGYLVTEIAVRVETALYDVDKPELVWTGYSQTLNPKSTQVVIDDVARLVVQELKREKLFR
jgi:hypothetical protein